MTSNAVGIGLPATLAPTWCLDFDQSVVRDYAGRGGGTLTIWEGQGDAGRGWGLAI